MKKLFILALTTLMSSCVVTDYYQLYKANTDNGTILDGKIVFDDSNCKVTYDLWAEGGNIGFNIYNKTENDMTIDLTKSFFILNGVSYEYFQNRTFSKSSSSGTTVTTYPYYYYLYYNPAKISGANSTSYSTSYEEKSELTIPSKTMVNVSEYRVSNSYYMNCDLPSFPSSRNAKTLKFDKTNSPFVFYNLITYKTKTELTRMENKFYVSEITNLPDNKMYSKVNTDACGKRNDIARKVFTYASPDKFYVHYTRGK